MKAITLTLMVSIAVLAGCAGQSAFQDNSAEVKLKHRIPSK